MDDYCRAGFVEVRARLVCMAREQKVHRRGAEQRPGKRAADNRAVRSTESEDHDSFGIGCVVVFRLHVRLDELVRN